MIPFLLSPRTILTISAVLPSIILMVHVLRKDKKEKEPLFFVLSLVLWGILSTLIAIALEKAGSFVLSLLFPHHTLLYYLLFYFVVVAASEEGSKLLILRKRTWRSSHFNSQYDAVVYSVAVSMGFALWENILYVFRYGFSTAIVRALTAVPGHASFGVVMGVWYGMEKRFSNERKGIRSFLSSLLVFLLPTLVHGTYDFLCLFSQSWEGTAVFIVFILILFIISWRMVNSASSRDRYI